MAAARPASMFVSPLGSHHTRWFRTRSGIAHRRCARHHCFSIAVMGGSCDCGVCGGPCFLCHPSGGLS
eukprot:121880-Prorocentrum_lima.AAC.1